MRLRTSFPTRATPDAAFAYLEDFGRIEEWDPFIGSAERLTPGEPRVGSVYIVRPKRGSFRLRYEVVDLDRRARRIRLVGSATGFLGWDEITVLPVDAGGSTVTYEAEIGLHGRGRLLYLLAPLLLVVGISFGGNAMRGMQRRLDALAGEAPSSGPEWPLESPLAGGARADRPEA
jgi:dehydrogenase/reductase SDR family protein 12